MSNKATIDQAYKKISSTLASRSSAFFAYSVSPTSDLLICFLDYWKIKNRGEGHFGIVTVYAENGKRIAYSAIREFKLNNVISVKEIIKESNDHGYLMMELKVW